MKKLLVGTASFLGLLLVILASTVAYIWLTRPDIPAFDQFISTDRPMQADTFSMQWTAMDNMPSALPQLAPLVFIPIGSSVAPSGLGRIPCFSSQSENLLATWLAELMAHEELLPPRAFFTEHPVAALRWCMAVSDLKHAWTPTQQLEAYLNMAPYREHITGIAAAAYALFGRKPSGLDAAQTAVLLATINTPALPDEQVAQRACYMLRTAQTPRANADCAAMRVLVQSSFARAQQCCYKTSP